MHQDILYSGLFSQMSSIFAFPFQFCINFFVKRIILEIFTDHFILPRKLSWIRKWLIVMFSQ